jgi:S1-C subfamily serine protease
VKDANVYLRRISLAGLTEARPRGVVVLDTWDQVSDAAKRLDLADALHLFARPSATRDNGVNPGEIVWYGAHAGAITPLRAVPAIKRDSVLAELTRGLMALDPLLKDARVGSLFSAWLHLPSLEDDVLVVGDQVVITNWGLLPQSIAGSVDQRRAHFAAGIGQLLSPGIASPPFEPDEALVAAAAAPEAAFASRETNLAGESLRPTLAADPYRGATAPVAPTFIVELAYRPWIPVAIATAIAAALLLILLIPGVLIYPSLGDVAARAPLDPELVAQTRNTLEAKARDLQGLLRDGVCTPAPGTTLPSGRGNPTSPGAPPAATPAPRGQGPQGEAPKGSSAAGPGTTSPGPAAGGTTSMGPLLPPSPGSLRGPSAPDGQPSTLVEYLDRVTTLVIAPSASGSGASVGTGFFVNDRHVVTNRHVVEGADVSRVAVVNKIRGRAIAGRVVGETRSSEIGGQDFAVIEVPPEANRPAISLSSTVARGDAVIAAGFPSFVMSTDDKFKRLMENDLSAVPDPAITQGWVTALQTGQNGQGLLVHGATISSGNSGGPLVDLCGRLVGVNTFGRIDTENALRLNFALRALGLKGFLTEQHIAFKSDDAPCDPTRIQGAAQPAQTSAPPPNPATDNSPSQSPQPGPTSQPPTQSQQK